MSLQVAVTYVKPVLVAANAIKGIVSDVIGQAIKMWWKQFLPGHFRRSAIGKYHYRPRTAEYMRRKARRVGHQNPLVFSGSLRAESRRTIRIQTYKGQARARGRLSGRVLNLYANGPPTPNHPPLADEIRFTTSDETTQMGKLIEAGLVRDIDALQGVRRVQLT